MFLAGLTNVKSVLDMISTLPVSSLSPDAAELFSGQGVEDTLSALLKLSPK